MPSWGGRAAVASSLAPGAITTGIANQTEYTIIGAPGQTNALLVVADSTLTHGLFVQPDGGAVITDYFGLGVASDVKLTRTGAKALQVGGDNAGSVGFYGAAPTAKAGAIGTPTAPGVVYAQAEAQSMKTAVDAIRTALSNIGITA